MTLVEVALHIKIGGSLVGIVAPALLLSRQQLAALTGVEAQDAALFRLYGMALLALLVVYASGYLTIRRGQFPWLVVLTGLVSNGGAAAILLAYGLGQPWKGMGFAFVGLVTLLLAASAGVELYRAGS